MGVNLEAMPLPEPTPSATFATRVKTLNGDAGSTDGTSMESTSVDIPKIESASGNLPNVESMLPSPTFEGFFAEAFDAVARALALTLGSDELGADAASEAMSRAYQRWSKISQYDNPSGWVYRVGLNWATSRRRKWRREIHGTRPPDNGVEDRRHDHALSTALAELPVDQRSVVVLRYYLDLSELDTASALGIAPGTVKSRLSRALARLASTLENDDGIR